VTAAAATEASGVGHQADGLLDTNVLLHAQTTDRHSTECRRFLAALEAGRSRARLEPLVLHELSYALRHYLKQLTREDVARYLLTVLSWDGVTGEKDLMTDAVQRWASSRDLAFVDAYLAAVAARRGCAVYTKNVAELKAQSVNTPTTLPS
jgi:predicted nucleic acid-binding protein